MNFDELTQPEFFEFEHQVKNEIENSYKPKTQLESKIVTETRQGFRASRIKKGTCMKCVYDQEGHSSDCEYIKTIISSYLEDR